MPTDTPATVLRGTERMLHTFNATAPSLPDPWGPVVRVLEQAVGFAADLFEHGIDPAEAIAVVRSSLPDVEAARREVDNLIRQKSGVDHG